VHKGKGVVMKFDLDQAGTRFWAVLEVWEPLLVGCVADAGERLVESKLLEWL
jgi:hypothetical protein